MSRKLIITAIASLIAIQSQVNAGWGYKNKENDKTTKNEEKPCEMTTIPAGMYHHDDRMFFIKGEYLFWQPHQEDLFYGLKTRVNDTVTKISFKQPTFDLSSGVRLGFGGFTSDDWDVGVTGMYIYSQGFSKTHSLVNVSNGSGTVIIPEFDAPLIGDSFKAHAVLRLNMFVTDFTIGREFFLTRRFAIHPIIGVRGFALYEKYHVRYLSRVDGTIGGTIISTHTGPAHFFAKERILGVGPRGGIDLSFYFSEQWSFLGGLSGSLLLSRYHTHQKYRYFNPTVVSASEVNFIPGVIKTRDRALLLRTNIDAYFGIGWDFWYNCDKNRVHVALLFEGSEWFGMNQLNDLVMTDIGSNTGNVTTVPDLRRHGDLGFIGGTLHFQLDF